ncbi:AraC family transcriptional regulator [Kitasatospora sp. NPDC006697]|uniref:AraC family transcriptional regulator n=1 Tax=Kitasatospora sp. NPDC006697 TaxID=3364020 RepID=UPI003678D6D2
MTSNSLPPAAPAGKACADAATIRPSILWYLISTVTERGIDLQPALDAVGLGPELLHRAELRISHRQGTAVIRRALELTGDPQLGLAVGAGQSLTARGQVGFALLAAETMWDAVELGIRYQDLAGAMVRFTAERPGADGGEFALRVELPAPEPDPGVAVFLVDEALANTVTFIRHGLGAGFAPLAVELAYPRPADDGPHSALFRCPVRFGAPANRCLVAANWARAPMPTRDPRVLSATVAMLEAESAARRERPVRQALTSALELSIASALPHPPPIAEQARRQAVSERTLRRRLAESGTTYEAVVDGVRRAEAERLLRDPAVTLREVARRVGFADERALRRAVRRWHGVAPLELRRALAQADGEGPAAGRDG